MFRVSARRRLGYPAALAAVALAAFLKWRLGGGDEGMRMFFLFISPVALLVFAYLGSIRLRIDPVGVCLAWPLRGAASVRWDCVVQVRRSESGPAGRFFIDLIESPAVSLQFDPYLFENSTEIIELLNRYLDSDLFERDGAPVDGLGLGVAVAAESAAAPSHQWTSVVLAVVLLALAVLLLCRWYL